MLVTGAAGYIGSHTVLALVRDGRDVIAVDDFSNSSRRVPERLAALSPRPIRWVELDLRTIKPLETVLAESGVSGVIHFAGLKSVAESCRDPVAYYDVNLGSTVSLLGAMQRHRIQRLVFSSSATVYDASQPSPVREDGVLGCVSPYGRSKWMAEQIIRDVEDAGGGLRFALLRYFNPVGADVSGHIGENPLGPPANLMPAMCRAAIGGGAAMQVFGNDYPTRDGSGVRDYVHVSDVARAHLAALERLEQVPQSLTLNIGSGRGYSVLEVLRAFTQATGVDVPYSIRGRRAGDVAELYADTSAARELLGWQAELDLDRMCRDAWRWHAMNPQGLGE